MSHFATLPDPGVYRRILNAEQAQRVVAMRDRGMSWAAIAAWFTRNGTPVSYQAVRTAHAWASRVAA
jgi:hypothetical protein